MDIFQLGTEYFRDTIMSSANDGADVEAKKIALAVVSWINGMADNSRASGDTDRAENLETAVRF